MSGKKGKKVCKDHPLRFAYVDRHGEFLCYECAYGKKAFLKRLGREFYEPGGPGYAGNNDVNKDLFEP